MQEIERRNPLLARVASGREAYYQPTPQINLNPNAMQLLRSIPTQVGNFFAENVRYAPQYQPSPYKTTMPQYNSYQGIAPPPEGSLQQRANQFFNENIAPFARDQLFQKALMGMAGGTALGSMGLAARESAPAILATLGAYRLTEPIANGFIRFGNTPVGNTLGKYADKVIDLIF